MTNHEFALECIASHTVSADVEQEAARLYRTALRGRTPGQALEVAALGQLGDIAEGLRLAREEYGDRP